jgi:hypothetical protein
MGSAVEGAFVSFLVYNHHSLPFSTAEHATQGVPDLIRTWHEAKRYGLSAIRVSARLDPSWMTIELAPDFRWETWLRREGQKTENRELVTAFLSLATNSSSPLLNDGSESAAGEAVDVRLSETTGTWEALHGAHCLGAPLLSHSTGDLWARDRISILVDRLTADASLETIAAELTNLSSPGAVDRNVGHLTALRDAAINDALQLWTERTVLFPGLVFCPSIATNLRVWPFGSAILGRVRDLLTELDRFARDWQEGKFQQYTHESLKKYVPRVSDESETVANNPKLLASRTFRLPSREKATFFFHVKMQEGFRIHYLPDGCTRTMYIGYIGRHLPLR